MCIERELPSLLEKLLTLYHRIVMDKTNLLPRQSGGLSHLSYSLADISSGPAYTSP